MSARVLTLIKGLGRGGAEQLLASAVPYVDRTRFQFEVAYLLPWKDALVSELRDAGLRVTCLDGARGVAWIGRLRRLVRERRIDLLHNHSPYTAIGSRVGLGRRIRRVYTEHNTWDRYHPLTRWGNMLTLHRVDHVFAVSDHVRDSIRYPAGLRWIRRPPVESLYHGIDPAAVATWAGGDGVRRELGVPEDAPVVGTVANFKTHKRLDDLLRAAVRVRREVPEARFVVVGQGPREAELRALARELSLDGSVVFTGFREDAPRIASSFDVFAMASEQEGLSIALIEAMALERSVVVTDAGGLPEVVRDGVQGFVVPTRDPVTLADRIVRLLRDPGLRERMGGAGRARAADFQIGRAVERMQAVYEVLLS
ncbi:MAG TPA: glycosyltransferase [Actinomycetota bacterium]